MDSCNGKTMETFQDTGRPWSPLLFYRNDANDYDSSTAGSFCLCGPKQLRERRSLARCLESGPKKRPLGGLQCTDQRMRERRRAAKSSRFFKAVCWPLENESILLASFWSTGEFVLERFLNGGGQPIIELG